MRAKRKTVMLAVLGLAVCLLAGCGKGGKANKQGLEWYAAGEYESAAAAFGDAIAADNSKSEYYINRALALTELGRYEQAQTCLDYADALDPDTLEGDRAQGILYYEQEMYQWALSSFADAISHSSGKVGAIEHDILYYTAECQTRLGQYAEAVKAYTQLIGTGDTSGDIYYLRGMAYLKNGDPSNAGLDFNRVVESGAYADYWRVYSLLEENGEHELAVQYLSQGVLLGGDTDSDHKWRGEFHYFLGNYEEALSEFRAVSESSMDVDAYMMMANIYQAMGNTDSVRAAFARAEAMDPDDLYLIYQEALFWMENGEYDTAYERISHGLAAEENEYRQQLEYCRAVCLEYQGDFAGALEAFRAYKETYGATDEINHEIAFLTTRQGHAE